MQVQVLVQAEIPSILFMIEFIVGDRFTEVKRGANVTAYGSELNRRVVQALKKLLPLCVMFYNY